MDIRSSALASALSVPPYQAGLPISTVAREIGMDPRSIVKLASNENPLGMPPLARAELAKLAEDPARYPDPDCFDLRRKLAERLGVSPDKLIIGAGATELIWLVVRAFVAKGRTAVMSQYAFTVYDSATRAADGQSIVVPAKDYGHDLDRMLAAIDERARVVFVASPNNPTGTALDPVALERFFDKVPEKVLLVFDEAYREFMDPDRRPDLHRLLAHYANILILRTFSKIYGLAGLRVGYGIAEPSIIDVLQRLRSPFSVNSMGQAAAIGALDDEAFVEKSYQSNRDELASLSRALERGAFFYVPSSANFVLVHVGDGPGVYRNLVRKGVIVRPLVNWGLPQWIRVTIGLPSENAVFLARLKEILPHGSPKAAAQ